jgi:multidrug efflux pump subunit AcrA (membrane-fusion protein)
MVSVQQWEQPMKGSARLLIWVLAAGLGSAAMWASQAKVSVYAQVRGTLAPKSQPVGVNVPSTGRVIASSAQLWQKVSKGQLLFTLDLSTRDPQDAALQQTIAQNASIQAQQDISAAQIELENRRRTEASDRSIYALGGLPKAEMDAAEAATRTAEAALQKAQSQLSAARAQLALLGRSQRVEVRSPVDGQVMQLSDLHVGQALGAGQSALAILPEGVPLVFKGAAAESDRPKLRPASRVQIAWNSYPRQKYGVSMGELSGVAPTSDLDKSGNVSYQIEVGLPQQEGRPHLGQKPLLPGMAGEAHVLADEKTVLGLFWDWLRGADPWS